MSATSSCSGLLVTRSKSSGIIFSNRNGEYSNDMDCSWTLSANTNIRLVFFRFQTEGSLDKVRVYNGISSSSSLLGEFDGISLPSVITSSNNALHIRFTTDSSVTKTGFAASYHGKIVLHFFSINLLIFLVWLGVGQCYEGKWWGKGD